MVYHLPMFHFSNSYWECNYACMVIFPTTGKVGTSKTGRYFLRAACDRKKRVLERRNTVKTFAAILTLLDMPGFSRPCNKSCPRPGPKSRPLNISTSRHLDISTYISTFRHQLDISKTRQLDISISRHFNNSTFGHFDILTSR